MSQEKHFQEQVLDLVLASSEEPINKVAALLNAAAMMAGRMGFTEDDMASTMRTAYQRNQARWRQYDREEARKASQ